MKNVVLGLALFSLLTHGVFARDEHPISIGMMEGVGIDTQDFKAEGVGYGDLPSGPGTAKFETVTKYLTWGIFLDTPYVEASAFILTQAGDAKGYYSLHFSTDSSATNDMDSRLINADLRVLLKFPVVLRDFTVFPLLGSEYSHNLSANMSKLPDGTLQSDLSAILIDLGAGIDFRLTNRYYLRLKTLYGINLKAGNTGFKDYHSTNGLTDYTASGSRLNFDLALGYKL